MCFIRSSPVYRLDHLPSYFSIYHTVCAAASPTVQGQSWAILTLRHSTCGNLTYFVDRIGGHGTGVCPDRAVIGVLHCVEQYLRHRLRIIVRLPAGRGRQQQRQCHQCGEATVDVLHAVLPCLSACPSTFIFQYRPYCGCCGFAHGARAMVGNIDVEAFDVWESYGLRTCADG